MPTKVKRDTRHLARRVALATLFCSMHGKNTNGNLCKTFKGGNGIRWEWIRSNTDRRVNKRYLRAQNTIDPIIEECAPQWPLAKIFRIDLVILEISIFELLNKGQYAWKSCDWRSSGTCQGVWKRHFKFLCKRCVGYRIRKKGEICILMR